MTASAPLARMRRRRVASCAGVALGQAYVCGGYADDGGAPVVKKLGGGQR